MEKQLLQVLEFQKAFNMMPPSKPKMASKKKATLRQKLLEEEVKEMREAENIIEVADALIDVLYITYGTLHEYGLADRATFLFDEVHRSNMSKLGPDGQALFRKDGKVMKSENYMEPNLRPIIERDFSIYKESEVMKEIAAMEKEETEKKIISKIKSKLSLFDKFLFWINEKVEKKLKKKIEVVFPIRSTDNIKVRVYNEEYTIF